jgi:tripartite-type tricarboxylate transporter receptor subunit TctC
MNLDHHQATRRTALMSALALAAGSAFGQSKYPDRPIKLIVPQPPGGGFDLVARVLSEPMGRALRQPIIVENRPGSGTVVGTDFVAKAAPDGYTLLVGSISNLAMNMGMFDKLPYDSLRDFQPLGMAVSYSYMLLARKDLPFSTLKDVIRYAKENPAKLTYASAGVGSGQHVIAAALWNQAGVNLVHVPYRGSQAAYQDVLGGRTDLFFDLSPAARAQVSGGNVRPLAVSGKARLATNPDVPTILETGVAPLSLESWLGIFAPTKTPDDVTAFLRNELRQVLASPEVMESFRKTGGLPLTLSAAETQQLVRSDVEYWSQMVRKMGIRAE